MISVTSFANINCLKELCNGHLEAKRLSMCCQIKLSVKLFTLSNSSYMSYSAWSYPGSNPHPITPPHFLPPISPLPPSCPPSPPPPRPTSHHLSCPSPHPLRSNVVTRPIFRAVLKIWSKLWNYTNLSMKTNRSTYFKTNFQNTILKFAQTNLSLNLILVSLKSTTPIPDLLQTNNNSLLSY